MKSPTSLPSVLLITLLSPLVAQFASAGSATWNLNPVSPDWKTAANWMPHTVPNGPGDIATFDVSSVTDVSTRENVLVESITFSSSASAFTITIGTSGNLSLIGSGIENNSGIMQNFETVGTWATRR